MMRRRPGDTHVEKVTALATGPFDANAPAASIEAAPQEIPAKRLYLYEMTWPQVRAALPGVKVAIIPTGSTEQHGPHGTFEVDTCRAREFSLRLAEKVYPSAIVTPTVQFGVSPHHIHFPGTITLRPETFGDILLDVALSLHRHGIRRFLFVNGHGGNRSTLTLTVNKLHQEYGALAAVVSPTGVVDDLVKQHFFSPIKGHACESEMSQVLYLWPAAMHTEYAEKGRIRDDVKANWGKVAVEEGRYWEELTENGALGDATLATAELGKEVMEAALDRVADYLKQFMEKKV